MVFETILHSDLQKLVQVKQLTGNLFSADNGGNKITVEILDGGAPATVSGAVYGYVIREDGKTVVIEGSLSGNRASITLPTSAYAVIGWIDVVIKVGNTTAGACRAYVYRTTTDVIVDPGSVVPDISELLAIIGDCEAATAAAEAAATAAGYVNVTSSKSGKVITIVTTNRNNQSTSTTITEPTMTVSESGGVVTVTCTDADGTTTVSFDATDIDDTAGAGDTDKIWSADKSVKELQKKADLIEVTDDTAEAVKTIQDGANGLPMELLIGIEPVQDLHGYDYPWPAGGGKNLLDTTQNTEGLIYNDDGTTGTNEIVTCTDYIPVTASTEYTISGQHMHQSNSTGSANSCGLRVVEFDSSKNFIIRSEAVTTGGILTKTFGATTAYVRYTYSKWAYDVQVELGSTPTTYAKYSNVCPISGWTGTKVNKAGRNLIPNGTDTSKGYVSGKLLKKDNTTSTSSSCNISEYFDVKAGETYTYAMDDTGTTQILSSICFYDKNKTYISGERFGTLRKITIQAPENAFFARATIYNNYASQVEPGTSISAFEAYKGTVHPITFPNEAGTVYGESLKINKDRTGELRNGRFAGTVQEIEAFTDTTPNVNAVSITVPEMISGSFNLIKGKVCFIAEKLKSSTYSTEYSAGFTNPYVCYAGSKNLLVILVPASMTVAEFNAEFAGMKYVYVNPDKVTTETTYNLTAEEVGIITSLYGINNIWADTGDILSLTYPVDTKLYVDKDNAQQDAEISATKGIIADSMTGTASRLIIVGELFIMNNTLYRATTNIANGATITPNTNCVATSIADEIGEYSETTLASGIIHYQRGRCHRLFIGGYVEFPNMVFVYPTVAEVESAIQTLGISWEVMYQHITINHKYVGYVGQAITSSNAFQIVYLDGTTESLPSSSATVTGNLIWFE